MTLLTRTLAGLLATAPIGPGGALSALGPDLARPVHARGSWILVAEHAGEAVTVLGDRAPGVLRLCLRRTASGPCVQDVTPAATGAAAGWEPHILRSARLVRAPPAGSAARLLIATASLPGANGDELRTTELLAWDAGRDRFRRVFLKTTGANRNEEVRYLEGGPLAGDMVAAEPTANAPYAYWIEVSRPGPDGAYRRVLRYRSAVRYGDGDPRAVIDAEMPRLLARLGRAPAGR